MCLARVPTPYMCSVFLIESAVERHSCYLAAMAEDLQFLVHLDLRGWKLTWCHLPSQLVFVSNNYAPNFVADPNTQSTNNFLDRSRSLCRSLMTFSDLNFLSSLSFLWWRLSLRLSQQLEHHLSVTVSATAGCFRCLGFCCRPHSYQLLPATSALLPPRAQRERRVPPGAVRLAFLPQTTARQSV